MNITRLDIEPWVRVFVIWPRKTISGRWVWLERVFKRKVMAIWGIGFHYEPGIEYATLFEVIASAEDDDGSAN